MAQIKNPTIINGAGGGNVINGIIEQYKADSGTIDANTFVEFVNKKGPDTDIWGSTQNPGYSLAIPLSGDTVFLVFCGNNYAFATVCTISGTTIMVGTIVRIADSGYMIKSAALAGDNKVLVAYTAYGGAYAVVCTISGTTITVGTRTTVANNKYANRGVSTATIAEDKVCVTHTYDNNYYLYAVVCTISGTTITVGTRAQVTRDNIGEFDKVPTVVASDNTVFVYYLGIFYYAVVCNISGTTITVGTITAVFGSASGLSETASSAALLETNKVFITGCPGSPYQLAATVCTISGTTITVGTEARLDKYDTFVGKYQSAVSVRSNKVFVLYSRPAVATSADTPDFLYAVVCAISGTTIMVGREMVISDNESSSVPNQPDGGYVSSAPLGNDRVLVTHFRSDSSSSSNRRGYARVIDTLLVSPANDPATIEGMTKTPCSDTTAGDVWVLGTN